MSIIERIKANECLVISPIAYKDSIIEELSETSIFYHAKFLTKKELKEKLFWSYSPTALYEFSKEYQIPVENAQIILEALYANINVLEKKELIEQKRWLEEKKHIIYHPEFLEYIKGKVVYVYGYSRCEMKMFLSKLEKYCTIEFIEEQGEFSPSIYEYETIEEEVVGVAQKIVELLDVNVPINKIFICNLNDDYKSIINRIFHCFHIPFEKNEKHPLFFYEWTQKFLSMLTPDMTMSQIENFFNTLEEEYPSNNELYHDFYEETYNILNKYYQKKRIVKDIYDILLYELKNTFLPNKKMLDACKIVDFYTYPFKQDDYIFIVGVNHTEFPKIKKDDDFYSDKEKERLNMPTSIEQNKDVEEKTTKKIMSLPNITLTYKKRSPFKEYIPSNLLKKWPLIPEKDIYDYSNKVYNTYLLNSALDDYMNYNIKKKELIDLFGIEEIKYKSYDNSYKKIKEEVFFKHIKECTLSYTSMQKYFECPFKYYIENILNVRAPFIETPSILVGNLFHSILEKYFKEKERLDEIIKEELEKLEIWPLEKKELLNTIYENEIRRLILLLEEQNKRSMFTPTFFEHEILFSDERKIKFNLYGIVDKILTCEDKDYAYIIVIDYKTSTTTADVSNLPYGLNMQLFYYLYLIKEHEMFKNYTIAGTYISPILEKMPTYKEGDTIDKLYQEQAKLNGFTIKRSDIIERLDKEYKVGSYIKGLAVKSDGEFRKNNNLISTPIMDKLLQIVEQKVEDIKKGIEQRDFNIEAKRFTGESTCFSCEYCKYKDICYKKAKDIKTMKKYKGLEFLEEVKNDTNKTDDIHMD